MTAFLAILVDGYRELVAKKLFMLSMILSLLVVAVFGVVGLNERGVTIFWYTLELPIFNSNTFTTAEFYKIMFNNLGVKFWLGWLACLLALVSSAGMFPEMVSSGVVENMLARPVPRWRLYIYKFTAGLLFTALQVAAFCLASFLVIGIRGGAWEPGLFLAIPLVTLLYSYLFAMSALLGTVTRSGIAALLLTILFWGFLFLINSAESIVNGFRIAQMEECKAIETMKVKRKAVNAEVDVSDLDAELERDQSTLANLQYWHRIVFAFKTILPKTDETTSLIQRWTLEASNMKDFSDDNEEEAAVETQKNQRRRGRGGFGNTRAKDSMVIAAIEEDQRSRSVSWIVGTSVLFELATIGLGCRLFAKRDF
ncbi:MAG: ABC transporter permease [Planctomycetes bacterium]|nr:ABC transporter permease [Planctomycetota bacterium]